MTGAEHYRRAEALLEYQQMPASYDIDDEGRFVESYGPVTGDDDPDDDRDISRNALMAAQTHATLALAAATADAGHCCNGWTDAIAKKPAVTS